MMIYVKVMTYDDFTRCTLRNNVALACYGAKSIKPKQAGEGGGGAKSTLPGFS